MEIKAKETTKIERQYQLDPAYDEEVFELIDLLYRLNTEHSYFFLKTLRDEEVEIEDWELLKLKEINDFEYEYSLVVPDVDLFIISNYLAEIKKELEAEWQEELQECKRNAITAY